MSRTRIVKGKITEITGGTSRIYGNRIIINSGGSIDYFAPNYTYGDPGEPPVSKYAKHDFDIKLELDTNQETIVPFGIADFQNNEENQFFRFKYTLEKSDIDEFYLDIISENGDYLYTHNCLKPAIIDNEYKEPFFKTEKTSKIPMNSALIPEGSPDFEPKDYTAMGTYTLSWDGFDKDGIYDSTRFNNKDLKAKITAIKNGRRKSIVVDFSTKYSQVEWADVKIDKNTKCIDVTLRVNLRDGGAEGLSCWNNPRNFNPPHTKSEICDWDKIPEEEINPDLPIIKTRTRSFSDLEKLAIEGLNYHWGRNKNHFIAKNVKINGEDFEVYMNAENLKEKAIGSIDLAYNTNGNWMRSGNPGSIKDPLSAAGNVISRQAICYNVGYIYYLDWYEFYKGKKWNYRLDTNEDIDFKFTSAHEVGHEILKKYEGTFYSYGHKGSVNSVFQYQYDNAPEYPKDSEIDIMPYYPISPNLSLFKNYAASEKDVLGLVWLTKIEIK